MNYESSQVQEAQQGLLIRVALNTKTYDERDDPGHVVEVSLFPLKYVHDATYGLQFFDSVDFDGKLFLLRWICYLPHRRRSHIQNPATKNWCSFNTAD